MLTQIDVPDSDDWWLMRCAKAMGQEFPRLYNLKRHREGDAPVPEEASAAMREAYAKWARQSRLVMAELIVNAKTNRQKAIGFRTAAVGDDLGDESAWATWKRSQLNVRSRGLFNDVGHYGAGYMNVLGSGDGDGEPDEPIIVPMNGFKAYSIQYATMPWLAQAAITIGYDDMLGADTITLHRPGYIRTAVFKTQVSTVPTDGNPWVPNTGYSWESGPVQLGYTDKVDIVQLEAPDGFGFYEKHLDSLDRINDGIKQRATIIAMQAFRQRAIEGDLPTHYPDDDPSRPGERIDYNDIFKAGPAALWMIPEGAKIWESAVTDVTPLLSASKEDIKHLAAVTSTPLYVLSPDAASGSAAGADLAKEMLSFSVEDLNDRADAAIALALGLAFEAQRDATRADPAGIETIWASIDRTSIIQRSAASPQAKAGGLPQRFIDELIFGMTPAQIRQARQDREDEAFNTPVAATEAPVDEPVATDPVVVDDPLAVPAVV